ncbi:TPA: S8 family peptidase [Bacillus cereus]
MSEKNTITIKQKCLNIQGLKMLNTLLQRNLGELNTDPDVNEFEVSLVVKINDEKQNQNQTQVVVKFRDDINLPYEDGVERFIQNKLNIFDSQREPDARSFTIKKLFNSMSPDKIKELATRGQGRDPDVSTPNLLSYFKIECPEGVDANQLVKELLNCEIVKTAYIDVPGTEAGIVNPADEPLFVEQHYLSPSPEGIDIEYAWGVPGGDGAGQSVIDVERGWTLNHEDLTNLQAQLLYGNIRDESRGHGTAVLGIIAAQNNQIGCIGIVPNVKSVNVVSYYNTGEQDAILAAIPHLEPGDMLILETQVNIGNQMLPIEVKPAVFDVIRLAVQNGIVVLEAAGNGGVDLDLYEANGKTIFNRLSSSFCDSGAIMVGASSALHPHKRMSFSNYGSRIDCYAWGEGVVTCYSDTSGDTKEYTHDFSGTSSATPIVAGAALAIQGIIQASRGNRLTPAEIRSILSNPTLGTMSENPMVDRIGVMPNLRAIIDSLQH